MMERTLRCFVKLILAWIFFTVEIEAFSATADVQVTNVESLPDWWALADVRYDEWIRDEGGTTSRQAFRASTFDIYQEERPDSLLFLAKQKASYVVGAAELSPYEVKGAMPPESPLVALYVTDVVTSRQYRRQGIARRMMECLEEYSISDGKTTHLVLNVKEDNVPATGFYKSLGYESPSSEFLEYFNPERLNENAGTEGQLLMQKSLR